MTLDPTGAGPRAEPSVVGEPSVFDATQRALLRAVLNRIVPPHADRAGAGDLDIGTSLERTLADSARLRRLFLDGLHDIAISSTADFVDLSPTDQTVVLQAVEQAHPAFFSTLVEHTYRGYYTHPLVQRALSSRPPQPIGYELPPFDPALLDTQRQRAPFWRPTP
jgi:hypothetical protein